MIGAVVGPEHLNQSCHCNLVSALSIVPGSVFTSRSAPTTSESWEDPSVASLEPLGKRGLEHIRLDFSIAGPSGVTPPFPYRIVLFSLFCR